LHKRYFQGGPSQTSASNRRETAFGGRRETVFFGEQPTSNGQAKTNVETDLKNQLRSQVRFKLN
jgi:hypothetical protein